MHPWRRFGMHTHSLASWGHRLGGGAVAGLMLISAAPAADFTVTNLDDSGAGSLRAAVAAAAALAGPDRIVFDPALNVGSSQILPVLSVIDLGSQELEIDASAVNLTLDADGRGRVFQASGGSVTLRRLTLQRGYTAEAGGAISTPGVLAMTDCVVTASYARLNAGALVAGAGSSFERCIFHSNSTGGSGGAIAGTPGTLVNCIVSYNHAAGDGGGIVVPGADGIFLSHCTVTKNTSGGFGGGIYMITFGGPLPNTTHLGLRNCIVAQNTPGLLGPDIYHQDSTPGGIGGSWADAIGLLLGNNEGAATAFPGGPLVGTPSAPIDARLSGIYAIPLSDSPALGAATASSVTVDLRRLPRPASGIDLGAIELQASDPSRARMINVSTRLRTTTGDGVAIAGFVIEGTVAKQVAIRVLGPSLTALGVAGALADPNMEIRSSSGALVASNDNFADDAASSDLLRLARLQPTNAQESALMLTLQPGSYTVQARGAGSASGACLVEVFDRTTTSSRLSNLSTRGQVGTGTDVMIAGFVVQGLVPKTVIIRALGPSLGALGVSGVLADPTLEIRDSAAKVAENDDRPAGVSGPLVPADPREPYLQLILPPGSYTAIVRGKNGSTGNALVEVYEGQ